MLNIDYFDQNMASSKEKSETKFNFNYGNDESQPFSFDKMAAAMKAEVKNRIVTKSDVRIGLETKTNILLELEQDLICHRCQLVPRSGKVYHCKEGHINCSQCHEQIHCPCGALIELGSCKVTENLLKILPTTCKFKKNGCLEILMEKDLQVHEEDCIYRNVWCPALGCKAQLSAKLPTNSLIISLFTPEFMKKRCQQQLHI